MRLGIATSLKALLLQGCLGSARGCSCKPVTHQLIVPRGSICAIVDVAICFGKFTKRGDRPTHVATQHDQARRHRGGRFNYKVTNSTPCLNCYMDISHSNIDNVALNDLCLGVPRFLSPDQANVPWECNYNSCTMQMVVARVALIVAAAFHLQHRERPLRARALPVRRGANSLRVEAHPGKHRERPIPSM